MARLFITDREIQYFNDIAKEIVKDIVGQRITYWPISTLKSKIHPVYNESMKKIFENPIIVDALVGQPTWETKMTQFGPEQICTIEVYVQARDIQQKGVEIFEGDYFTYGQESYEIVSAINMGNYFGQTEHDQGTKIKGILARVGEFDPKTLFPPTEVTTPGTAWEQQRGLPENTEGPTGDIREVRERLRDDMAPIALDTGPRKIKVDSSGRATTFSYDE